MRTSLQKGALEMSRYSEEFQKIRMCVQTYLQLYGIMPGIRELLEWLGDSYREAISKYLMQANETAFQMA